MRTATQINNNTPGSRPTRTFFGKSNEGGLFSQSQDTASRFFPNATIQPKLKIGQPDDAHEREADAMAEKVTQGNDHLTPVPSVQKKCDDCEQEEKIDKKEEESEEKQILRKPIFESDADSSEGNIQTKSSDPTPKNIEGQLNSSKGKGQPLPKSVRNEMEPGFGANFEKVGIHTDTNAVQMNSDLNAQAFTNGSDVYFNQGKFQPENKEGKKLIAHELTHVVQQTGKGNPTNSDSIQPKSKKIQRKPKSQNKVPPPMKLGNKRMSTKQLSNGQQQLIQETPFTQYIARKEDPATENGEGQTAENAEGQAQPEAPIFIDEVKASKEALAATHDSTIGSTLAYAPTVTPGRVPDPGDFGTTGPTLSIKDVAIASSFGTIFNSGHYTVTGNFVYAITWGTLSGIGKDGQIDIQNENDPDIKACNYQLVTKDLTPNMASDNGRPPRTEFWAEDLTRQHELFHADNQMRLSWGPQINTAMQNWLDTQTSPSGSHIRTTLIRQALGEGVKVHDALVKLPATEGDAYGDGAPSYLARANAIKTKGDAGDYGQVSFKVTVHPKGGGSHTVVKGDTLWAIAKSTYGHGKFWRRIHDANPGLAKRGGNLILPGQVFNLPNVNIDKELSLALSFGPHLVFTTDVLIPGGGSHVFTELPTTFFDDSTNCVGDFNVEVLDVDANSLLATIWSLPANSNARSGNIEVDTEITSGPVGGP